MKKLLIAALTFVLGSFGYAIVDATLENRVNNLEASYIALSEQFDNHLATNETTTEKSTDITSDVTSTTVPPEPEVTYYEKYVKDVIQSKNYTMSMQMDDAGQNVTLEIFSDGERKSYKGIINFNGVAMSFRFFEKDGKSYVVLPTLMRYLELDKTDPIVEKVENKISTFQDTIAMFTAADEMTYCGISSGVGYVCESYKDSNGTIYNYYFNSSGLTRVEVSEPSSNISSIRISLTSEVSDKGVFEIPIGYIKTTVQEFEELLGGLSY